MVNRSLNIFLIAPKECWLADGLKSDALPQKMGR